MPSTPNHLPRGKARRSTGLRNQKVILSLIAIALAFRILVSPESVAHTDIMQVAATSSAVAVPCASTRVASSRSSLGSIAGLTPVFRSRQSRRAVTVRAEKPQVSFSLCEHCKTPHEHRFSSRIGGICGNVVKLVQHARDLRVTCFVRRYISRICKLGSISTPHIVLLKAGQAYLD